jgi:UDP-N-acetylglucosamine--N-acetylmuramyl-(pentapeptide) pyrophosphoryl-undecaprenol N-acetylglucosamine transferase
VFSGGGTGGHLYPALALADAVVALRPDVFPHFVGAAGGVEATILPGRGADYSLLPVQGFARGGGLRALRAVPRLAASILRVAELFQALRPRAVVVTGGYAGGPAGIVAGARRIPLVIQEQNAMPGVTTRLLSRWAAQVHVAFPEAVALLPAGARSRAKVSGNPVRPGRGMDRVPARRAMGLSPDGTTVLVMGGSQGSAALNRVVLEAVAAVCGGALPAVENLSLLWSTGPRHHDAVAAALAEGGSPAWVHAVPYIHDVDAALTASDFAVSRAGAMTTAELLNAGLPAILVPLPTAAADHQARNAEALEQAGAALVSPEQGLTGRILWDQVTRLASDGDTRARMAAAARGRARPGAAGEIAAHIVSLLPGSPA